MKSSAPDTANQNGRMASRRSLLRMGAAGLGALAAPSALIAQSSEPVAGFDVDQLQIVWEKMRGDFNKGGPSSVTAADSARRIAYAIIGYRLVHKPLKDEDSGEFRDNYLPFWTKVMQAELKPEQIEFAGDFLKQTSDALSRASDSAKAAFQSLVKAFYQEAAGPKSQAVPIVLRGAIYMSLKAYNVDRTAWLHWSPKTFTWPLCIL